MHPLILLAIIWVGFELVISILLRSNKSKAVSFDRSSILIIWLVLSLSVTAAVFESFRFNQPSAFVYYSGLGIIIAGMILRITAIISLRKMFTTTIAIQDDHALKTNGLYSFIRHPSYTGSLISFAGLGIAFGNCLSLLTLLIPITAVFIYRIRLEEKMLGKHFGNEYEDYKKKTKKLIPFIY
jgi:protein-S-isoprenylcysteine O-methyltransferase Ste14